MDNINDMGNENLISQQNNFDKKFLLGKLLLVVFILGFSTFIAYYLGLNNKTKNEQTSRTVNEQIKTENVSWKTPVFDKKIIPIVKNEFLHIYNISEKKLVSTDYKTSWGNGSSNIGSDNPLLSPNGGYVVFINKSDNNSLYLINSNLETKKITQYPVKYLDDWSPNGKEILFYVNEENLDSRKEGEGIGWPENWEKVEKFNKDTLGGFHLFNIETGIDTYLYPLKSADQFIDNDRIASIVQNGNDSRLAVFNTKTFEADYSLVSHVLPFGSGDGQQSFTSDGKNWAFTYSNNPTNDANIIYANFPKKDGITIESGKWAEVQKPFISPDGKYVIYSKKGEQIRTGVWQDLIRIWGSNSKKIIKEIKGYPWYWLDNNSFVYVLPDLETGLTFNSLNIYYINNGTTETVDLTN